MGIPARPPHSFPFLPHEFFHVLFGFMLGGGGGWLLGQHPPPSPPTRGGGRLFRPPSPPHGCFPSLALSLLCFFFVSRFFACSRLRMCACSFCAGPCVWGVGCVCGCGGCGLTRTRRAVTRPPRPARHTGLCGWRARVCAVERGGRGAVAWVGPRPSPLFSSFFLVLWVWVGLS